MNADERGWGRGNRLEDERGNLVSLLPSSTLSPFFRHLRLSAFIGGSYPDSEPRIEKPQPAVGRKAINPKDLWTRRQRLSAGTLFGEEPPAISRPSKSTDPLCLPHAIRPCTFVAHRLRCAQVEGVF